MQRIASDNKPAEQNKTHKTPSDHWFGAMVFGGGLAVVAVLALPLAVPAIAVGAGAVGLGAVASSTAIGLGFVTTGAVAGGALGYNYGSDVTDFIEKNITHLDKVAASVKESGEAIGERVSGDITGIKADGQASSQQSARSEVVNHKIRELSADPSANNMGGEQQTQESIPATPQQKEKTLAFFKKFMEFRIQGVDKILKEKSDNGSKKSSIESFLNDVDKSFSLDITKDKLCIPESEKEKCKELFEKKAPTCFDILREGRQGVATDEKIIKELSKIITYKFKIKSLLSAGEDEAVVDKVKNFSKEFESYWKNTGDKQATQATSLIEKDVEAIKEILKESPQKGEYQNEAHIYFENSAEPKKETPSATPRAPGCNIVGSDQLKQRN